MIFSVLEMGTLMDGTQPVSLVVAIMFWISLGGILYTYFGYPLAIYLLARLFGRREGFPETRPSVTLLIAAYNEEAVMEGKIRNSLALDYPKNLLQILIVTDGSTDMTPGIAKRYRNSGIEVLHRELRQGKMAAIKRALPHARGDVVVFSDANNHYPSDTISRLVAPFADAGVGATTGAKVISSAGGGLGASEGLYWRYESFIKKQESALGSCTSAAGEILAIRRHLFSSPPDRVINDDFYIAMQVIRQGYRLVYVPEAKSIEAVSPSAQDEVTRRTRINAGRYQAMAMAGQILPFNRPVLVWQILSHKFLRPLVPFAMIVLAVSNILVVLLPPSSNGLLTLSPPYGTALLLLQILFYTVAWLGGRAGGPGRQSRLLRLLYIPTFLTNSNLAAMLGFLKFARGQQSHVWDRVERS